VDPPPPPPPPSFAGLTPAPPFEPTAGLEPWQAGVLAGAYLKGKRTISIQEVAAAADIDRAGVIAWFKAVDALLPAGANDADEAGRTAAKASALAALVAAGEADAAVAGRAAVAAATRAAAADAAAAAEGRAWSPPPADRRFSAAALATLERVFEEVRGRRGDKMARASAPTVFGRSPSHSAPFIHYSVALPA